MTLALKKLMGFSGKTNVYILKNGSHAGSKSHHDDQWTYVHSAVSKRKDT